MTRIINALAIVAVLLFATEARAQRDEQLNRDEVTVVKKKLVAVLDAVGQPPAGYSVEHENFSLPTQAYKIEKSGLWQLLGASASRDYGTQKKSDQANKDLQKEYEKKMAEATAKGDYAAMGKLAQEMQKKAGEQQLKAAETKKDPVNLNIHFNSNPGATIDPDLVLFERSGVIALKSKDEYSPGNIRVYIYFDPIALKNTKQLSRVDMKYPDDGVAKKTTVLNVTIQMSGPATEVEPWAKKIDTGKVLAQVDASK